MRENFKWHGTENIFKHAFNPHRSMLEASHMN